MYSLIVRKIKCAFLSTYTSVKISKLGQSQETEEYLYSLQHLFNEYIIIVKVNIW